MASAWYFTQAKPGDKARESKVEEFFKSDAVRDRANAVVREGIQNSLDAADGNAPVRIRIAIGEWAEEDAKTRLPKYERGFRDHLGTEGVTKKISNLPALGDTFRYLVFEDFGTSGLLGNPAEWWPDEHDESGAFFKYFRAEGISGKSDGARGRHGVGRLVFMFASRARMMFGLTRRNSGEGASEELLMGTAVLRNHRLGSVPYLPDGWYGQPSSDVTGLVLPLNEFSQVDEFKAHFNLLRKHENGLSVVVPWLSDDVTFQGILRAVIAEYFYPILSGALSVELTEGSHKVPIDSNTLDSALDECPIDFAEPCRAFIRLARAGREAENWIALELQADGAPKWGSGVLTDDLAQVVVEALEQGPLFLRIPVVVRPKGRPPIKSEFLVLLERDLAIGESQVRFIREGIHVSDVRPRRTSGFRSLVVVEKGPLGQFLGDAENPSHTQWQKDMVRGNYTHHAALIDFVVGSIPGLALEISRQQEKADTALLLDLFSLPADSGLHRNQETKQAQEGTETDGPAIAVDGKPRKFNVTSRGSGFVVRRGDPEAPLPKTLAIKVAYDVRKGNPFKKYEAADFELGKAGIRVTTSGCEVLHLAGNSALVRIQSPDFGFDVQGFDVQRRDITVDVRVLGEGGDEPSAKAEFHKAEGHKNAS